MSQILRFGNTCTLLLLLLLMMHVGSTEAQDNLQVEFNFTSIEDTTEFRGVKAGFPYPVMSLITVRDQDGRYVHGLADTTKWLYPQDQTESGHLVDSVWSVILEYHEEDPAIPADRNAKNMRPDYMVTEVLDVAGYGLSVPLVMDYSGSMGDDIYVAENASRTFIRAMSTNDRVEIIKFTGKVRLIQEFTSDTTKLMEAISKQPDDREFTAVYDALYAAMVDVLKEAGRRAVVAYTDGKDNFSSQDVQDVIDFAKANDIPIYMIGLGDAVDADILKQIGEESGGQYWAAPTADELASIYLEILKLIRGFYVMAHTSTDPWENGTWRLIDLTIEDEGDKGSGQGKYFVPFVRPNMTIQKKAITDSIQVAGGDTLNFAIAGDTIEYEIRLKNSGSAAAPDVRVVDHLPDSLQLIGGIQPPPVQQAGDSIVWQFDRIEPDTTLVLRYRVKLSSVMPMGQSILRNLARVECAIDSPLTDNEVRIPLFALGLPDLTVICEDPDYVASPGFPGPLTATVFNTGNAHATSPFTVGFFLPGESAPFAVETVPGLNIGQSALVSITHAFMFPGTIEVRVFVDQGRVIDELNEANNEDACQVQVSIDSLWVQFSDFTYSEQIREKQGLFYQRILSRVHVGDQNLLPVFGLADSSQWLASDGLASSGLTVSEHWKTLHEKISTSVVTNDVYPTFEIIEQNGCDISIVLAADFSGDAQPGSSDLQTAWGDWVSGLKETDAAAVFNLNNLDAAYLTWSTDQTQLNQAIDRNYSLGERHLFDAVDRAVSYAATHEGRQAVLAVTAGGDDGSSQKMSDVLEKTRILGVPLFIVDPSGAGLGDSLDVLALKSGGLYLTEAAGYPIETAFDRCNRLLRNYYTISWTSPDTTQDQSWRAVDLSLSAYGHSAVDTGLYRAPLGPADLRISKKATGSSQTVFEGDSLWQVQAGDSVRYQVDIWNAGHQPLINFQVRDGLPQNLVFARSDPAPAEVRADSVIWMIPSLEVDERTSIRYTCFVDTLSENKQVLLVNGAEIIAPSDTIRHNNVARDTVVYIPLQGADLSVSKSAVGDSMSVSNGDTTWYVHAGELITYRVRVANSGEKACESIELEDILPEFTTLVIPPANLYTLTGDTLRWTLSQLGSRGASKIFTYTLRVDSLLPPWSVPLVNALLAGCDGDINDFNNSDSDTVWTVGMQTPDPEIRLTPSLINPTDTVKVEVMTPVPVLRWDLTVLFEDGSQNTVYGDAFISITDLNPGIWTRVDPALDDTRMRTQNEEERACVVLETEDVWGAVKTDTACFEIRSSDVFLLDENVFRIGSGKPLGLRFQLSSNRWATINIYDIAGNFVKKAVDGPYPAGWNIEYWDGTDEQGRPVGSGLYVAILISGNFQESLKFILVR